MTRFQYTPVLFNAVASNGDSVRVFYQVSHGVGLVPAEIDFTYHRKQYTTMKVIELIAKVIEKKHQDKLQVGLGFTWEDWYAPDNHAFDKLMFVALTRYLQDMIEKPRKKSSTAYFNWRRK